MQRGSLILWKAELVNDERIDTGTQAESWATSLATKTFYKHSNTISVEHSFSHSQAFLTNTHSLKYYHYPRKFEHIIILNTGKILLRIHSIALIHTFFYILNFHNILVPFLFYFINLDYSYDTNHLKCHLITVNLLTQTGAVHPNHHSSW